MIIKEIRIKNFRSYYGDKNVFNFSDGLTLILGENGDGKTTFFEALQWLFDTSNDKGNIDHASEMRKSKLEIGEHDEVSVFMSFEHDGLKSVEKSFVFERTEKDTFKVGALSFRGYETNGAEREQVSGKLLIDRCYDAFIRRFSMFKGESELNVFNDKYALKQLVDKFSDIRKFDEFVERTKSFEEKANNAYSREMKSDEKVAREVQVIESRLRTVNQNVTDLRRDIREKQDSIDSYSVRLEELEANQESSQRYKEIEDRRKNLEDKRFSLKGKIDNINYNHHLLDQSWILCAFPSVFDEFKTKCQALSLERRKKENEFIRTKSEEVGKLKAYQEVQAEFVKLPWFVPDETHMQEMVAEHVCKVCGRPFEENSDAHKFILEKIKDFQNHTLFKAKSAEEIKKVEAKTLFKNNYIEELQHKSISLSGNNQSFIVGISQEINDKRGLVDRYRFDLKKIEANLQEIQDEKARLLIQAGNVSEEILKKDFDDIRGLFDQKERAKVRLAELKKELEEKEKIQKELKDNRDALDPQSSKAKLMRNVYRTLAEIARAFANAKDENLRRFLSEMENKANKYLEALSVSDFHGNIRLVQTVNESTEIKLFSSNGTEIKKPSGSQETVMYMSVLFAISDFTQEKQDEDYPLIFDAATSSFGDEKEDDFYNVVNKVNKQCIIVTKDFITKGEVRFKDIEKLNCLIYRIKKAKGFDPNNLATIRTTVEKIKE